MPGRLPPRTCSAMSSGGIASGWIATAFLLGAVLMASLISPAAGSGQDPPVSRDPDTTTQSPRGGVLSGQVLIGELPADSGTVVLHHVSRQSSGEVDSVTVSEDGTFEIPLPEVAGDGTDDVFFATIRYQDVLYVGEAITAQPEAGGGTYVIQAYPAIPAAQGVGARIRIRNLFAEPLDPGPGWAVADYFELGNDTRATLVASEQGPTWSHALPPEATDFRVGRTSDLSADMASFREGRVHVSAPILPGGRAYLYLFRYTIATDRFTVPMEGTVGSMELLVREPAGEVAVTGLLSVPEVEIEVVSYTRFSGRDMAPSVISVDRGGGDEGPLSPVSLAAVLLTLALAGAGALVAARSRSARRPSASGRTRQEVLVAVARLDEERGAGRVRREDYESRRMRLLEELDP